MPLVVRPAHADDLVRAQELVVRSINDLTARHGFGSIASARAPDFQAFCLRDDPRGVWLAEDGNEIAGFAPSWTCDPLWFLAELFVEPGRQGEGIGNQLLDRTLRHASEAGATAKSLITFAFNVAAQGLYLRHGLAPRLPIHLCSAEREDLESQAWHRMLRTTPIRPTTADLAVLRQLDIAALGVSRERHHLFLLGDPTMAGVFFEEGGECMGYAYVSSTGHLGPLAVLDARAMPAVFRTALALAVAGEARRVSAFIPGSSEALAIAAGHGMRLVLPMTLMAEGDCGDWTRYVPRNPGFM